MNLKKYLRNKGCEDIGLRNRSDPAQAFSTRLIAIAKLSRR